MGIVTIDFETYYDRDYSLRKLSTADYILDPRFEAILCAVKVDHAPTVVHVGREVIQDALGQIDWSRNCLLSHHARFDGSIAAWHFGVEPCLYLDTLSMARALTHSVVGSSSLEKVAEYLGLPAKGKAVYNALGLNLEAMARTGFLVDYMAYCLNDTDLCRAIFDRFMAVFPKAELAVADMFLRMHIQPQVNLAWGPLNDHLADVVMKKAAALNKVAHIEKSVFSSNQKFAALLIEHGVEVPTKKSPTTGEETYALAKNDRAFKELCADETQSTEVQALLAARLGVKSTLEETRTLRLMHYADRSGVHVRGVAYVPMKYYGAHTGRVSGDDGVNWLNFTRGAAVRKGVVAPDGWRVVHRDSSQIEARGVATLARCETLINAFEDPARDPYCEFASAHVYHRRVTKADVKERFVGKTAVLGLGYQCGWEKFRHMLFIGNGGISVQIDEREARDIVYGFRRAYPEIPSLWDRGEHLITRMRGQAAPIGPGLPRLEWRPGIVAFPVVETGPEAIWLPNGLCIAYPNLRVDMVAREIVYDSPYKEPKKLYGGKITENIDQALSRIIITDAALRIYRRTGWRPFMHTYDSLDWCVPEGEAKAFDQIAEEEFAVRPTWEPRWPLASEGGWGRTLWEAEKAMNL